MYFVCAVRCSIGLSIARVVIQGRYTGKSSGTLSSCCLYLRDLFLQLIVAISEIQINSLVEEGQNTVCDLVPVSLVNGREESECSDPRKRLGSSSPDVGPRNDSALRPEENLAEYSGVAVQKH